MFIISPLAPGDSTKNGLTHTFVIANEWLIDVATGQASPNIVVHWPHCSPAAVSHMIVIGFGLHQSSQMPRAHLLRENSSTPTDSSSPPLINRPGLDFIHPFRQIDPLDFITRGGLPSENLLKHGFGDNCANRKEVVAPP